MVTYNGMGVSEVDGKVQDILELGYSELVKYDRILIRILPMQKRLITNLMISEILLDCDVPWTSEDNDNILVPPLVLLDPKNTELREKLKDFFKKSNINVCFKAVLYNEGRERKNLGPIFLKVAELFDGRLLKGSELLGHERSEQIFKEGRLDYLLNIIPITLDDRWGIDVSYLYHIGAFDSYSEEVREEVWKRLYLSYYTKNNLIRGKYFKFLY